MAPVGKPETPLHDLSSARQSGGFYFFFNAYFEVLHDGIGEEALTSAARKHLGFTGGIGLDPHLDQLADTDSLDGRKAQIVQGMLDGLSLWVED